MAMLETAITAVTVYINRARVTRRGKITLQPGEQTLTLDNLPTTIEQDSVRASGHGAGVRILGVDVKTEYISQAPEASLADLEKQRDDLTAQDQALVAVDNAQESRLDFLKMLRDHGGVHFGRTLAGGRTTLDSVAALSNYLTEEWSAIQTRRDEIADQRRKLAKEIEAVNKRMQQQSIRRDQRRSIQVSVEAEAEVEFELDVIYAVTSASWQPLYDVRLVDDKIVTLTYMATITQKSGEDWPEVDLALSTARPAISTSLPELDPWYLDRWQQPVPRAKASFGMQRQLEARLSMAADYDELEAQPLRAGGLAPAAPQPAPAQIAQTTVENSGGAAVTYRVSKPVAVPSDGTPHKTTVTALDMEVKLDHITVPKLAEEAYLRATVTNTSDFILLPGEASIFHGADFVGKTDIDNTAPGEEFEVQLGVDDRLRVERELVKREVSKNLIGNNRRTQFAYKITLNNLLPAPARVTIFDQIPLGRHESIKIKLESVSPEPAERTDLNILEWNLELKPGEKREIGYTFTVEHPRDMDVVGLT